MGEDLAPKGVTLKKIIPPPRPAPPGLTVPPSMGRRRLILFRFRVLVSFGESYPEADTSLEGVPIVIILQVDPPRPAPTGPMAPLDMG